MERETNVVTLRCIYTFVVESPKEKTFFGTLKFQIREAVAEVSLGEGEVIARKAEFAVKEPLLSAFHQMVSLPWPITTPSSFSVKVARLSSFLSKRFRLIPISQVMASEIQQSATDCCFLEEMAYKSGKDKAKGRRINPSIFPKSH